VSLLRVVKAFLKAHPAICLLLLTPGIPEYLSGSSPINAIILNPAQFVFQLTANLGLYGPGVLLIREARIRWNRGLATVFLLGAAYGILEEGIALSTLFDPEAGPVGVLGTYGHWVGVNWIWVASILPVHMIFSIALPILLLGLALPETRGRSFLPGRKLWIALLVLGIDVASLLVIVVKVTHFWMGWPIFLASWATIGMLILAARRAPSNALAARSELPRLGKMKVGFIGAVFYPSVLLTEFIPAAIGIPAVADFAVVILLQGAFLVGILKVVGRVSNERVVLSLALGLIVPIAAFGVISERALPMTLIADGVMMLFFRKLWQDHPVKGGVESEVDRRKTQISTL